MFFWCIVTELSLWSSSCKLLEWSQYINVKALSCKLLIFLLYWFAVIHPYEWTVIKLRWKVRIEKYSLFIFIHVVRNSSECMKFITGCFANLEIWWSKFNWLSNVTLRSFSNLVLEILFSLIFASELSFLLKSKWHSGLPFNPLFSNHSKTDFEDFTNWVITYSEVKYYFFLCSIVCYRLHSLQSLCHYEKETYLSLQKRNISDKNILNKSGPSIGHCGTPTTISNHELNCSFILSLCLRSVK